jgi:bifunctional DNA-binding transcriptional regulator/antitoxin component of YhaV-PrlF toxin-antitoxin module
MEKQVYRALLRAKGQLTVANPIRATLDLNEGDELSHSVTESGTILIRPARVIPAHRTWLWTGRWQKDEKLPEGEDLPPGTLAEDLAVLLRALDLALAHLLGPPLPGAFS